MSNGKTYYKIVKTKKKPEFISSETRAEIEKIPVIHDANMTVEEFLKIFPSGTDFSKTRILVEGNFDCETRLTIELDD